MIDNSREMHHTRNVIYKLKPGRNLMKKYTISLFALLCFLNIVQSQDSEKMLKNQIEVGFGYQNIYLKDNNFSTLNQVGGGFATLLNYKRASKNIFGVSLQFSPGNVNSGPDNGFTTSYINASLEFEYLSKLTQGENAYQFFLGPVYNTRVLYLDWNDLDAFSYVATHGISIKGLISKKVKEKHLFQATFSVPVFQFLGRPPYNGIDEFIIENQDSPAKIILSGTPTSINNYVALEFCVNYKYKLTQQIDWYTNYTLFAQKVKAPNLLKSFSNTILTGIAINF